MFQNTKISKIPEAYDVIEQLIRDLDSEEMGEIPAVIILKYADPEDLCERLNAMFAEAGTSAPIKRTIQGLSEYSMETSGTAEDTSSNASGQIVVVILLKLCMCPMIRIPHVVGNTLCSKWMGSTMDMYVHPVGTCGVMNSHRFLL